MKLEMAILAGPESKAWLLAFTKQVDRLEALASNGALTSGDAHTEDTADEAIEESYSFDDDAEVTTSKVKKAASSFDDEEETDATEEEIAPKKSATKAKSTAPKVKKEDVMKAAKEKAASIGGTKGRAAVLKILAKWDTETVTDLDPADYADVFAALKK